MARQRVSVIKESESGRNILFRDNYTNKKMTNKQFVTEIEKGRYEGKYHIRLNNKIKTPVSNPDSTKNNNLG